MRKEFKICLGISVGIHMLAFAGVSLFRPEPAAPVLVREVATIELLSAPAEPESKPAPEPEEPESVAVAAPPAPPPIVPIPAVTEVKPEPPKIEKPEPIVEKKEEPTPAPVIAAPSPVRVPTNKPIQVAATSHPSPIRTMTEGKGDGSSANPGLGLTTSESTKGEMISTKARYRKNPEAAYPAIAKRRREEGTVLLTVSVDNDGRAKNVRLKESSGFSTLDTAAEEAVRAWEFEPARLNDKPIPSEVEVPIRFELPR